MTRTFNIACRESVIYTCIKITVLADKVFFITDNQVVVVLLMARGLVARLNICSAVAFFKRVNQTKIYAY